VARVNFLGQNGRAFGGLAVTRASVTCALFLAVFLTATHARQSSPSSAPKPLVPAAASSIAANPDAYYGQHVSVTAAVDRILSPTSFMVDQNPRESGTGQVLVLVDILTAPLAVNSYVTIIGEVVRHEDRPAIRATSVLNAGMVDLARRPPVPLTPEEVAFDAVMKRINPAFGAIRQAVNEAAGYEGVEHAVTLKQAFAETETFWKKRAKPDAMKWAAEARRHAEVLEQAITAGKWDDAKAALTGLQQTCSACHAAYRQRGDDGSYRIR
jgi:cytochrome c556